VDLSQFRNDEVGKGYKAKHVVRQKEAEAVSEGVVDMSGGAFSTRDDKEKSSKKQRKHEKKSSKRKRDHGKDGNEQKDSRLDSYLRCKGLKTFLIDIEKMISQDNIRR
jgi:Na+-transporting NADH:ubiquinone oxidoreductase subunit NqrC